MKNQVESVLTTAKIGKGEISLNLELVDLHQLVSEATESIRMDLKDNFKLELEADKTIITADKMHLMNVIRNLVDNAKKYSKQPSEIIFKTYNDENSVFLEVKDQGIGISKEHIKKIFDKFYRVPTGNIHNVKGFGLGLNYVKEIVKKHKWHISVESEPGEGTTFLIKIPIS